MSTSADYANRRGGVYTCLPVPTTPTKGVGVYTCLSVPTRPTTGVGFYTCLPVPNPNVVGITGTIVGMIGTGRP